MTGPRDSLSRPVRVLAGIASAFACSLFGLLGIATLGAGANALLALAVLGSVGGCLLDAALFGSRRPWRSFWCLPVLYVLQVGSVLLALRLFPYDAAAHLGFCLAGSAVFVALFHGAGYFRTDRRTSGSTA